MFDDRKDIEVIVQECGDVFMRLNPELRKLNVEEIKLKPHFPAAWYIEFYPVQFDCVSKSLNFDERDHVHGNIIG